MNQPPLNDCGCCAGLASETPAPVGNRDGLSAIAYRCGTYAQFKASMLAALSSSRHPALRALQTRDDDDFSIALLDAWAVAADVFTFYQERIAQESYLRTAGERRSLLELARLIGYELRPGVAAETRLAFTLDELPGAPPRITLEAGAKVQSIPGPGEKAQTFETVEPFEARAEWNAIKARATRPQVIDSKTQTIYLHGVSANLRTGDTLLVLTANPPNDPNHWGLLRVLRATIDPAANRTTIDLEESFAGFRDTSAMRVFALRQRASLFGHNAPDPHILSHSTLQNLKDLLTPNNPGSPLPKGVDWTFEVVGDAIDLDTTYSSITAGTDSWLVLNHPDKLALCTIDRTVETGRTDFALAAKVTRLSLKVAANGPALSEFGGQFLRGTTVFAQSEELTLAEAPLAKTVSGGSLDLAQSVEGFAKGRVLAISGLRDGTKEPFRQLVTLSADVAATEFPTIQFFPGLPVLERASVTVNANVVLATHGETVEEILGSGDASHPYPRFALRQPPLTYVHGAGSSGAVSTLTLRVNDLLWHETPTLYGRGPRERVFITRTGDDGRTTVQFGDGRTGARPPTGQDNLRARYRKGIGREGNVGAGQLSTLLTRPLGLKAVTNPAAATGGADGEQLADVRRNAPLTVLTLDRIVSLQDYEDFARAYAGIGKALATWTWDGRQRGVFLTVAAKDGAEIEEGVLKRLLEAIHAAGDPFVPVRAASYHQRAGLFHLAARVKVDPDHESAKVLDAVTLALRDAFSFDAREFGQPVALSEVLAVMQVVPGVVAVAADRLYRPDESDSLWRIEDRIRRQPPALRRTFNVRLLAALPEAGAGGVLAPAELLRLDPCPLALEVMP